MSETLDGTCHCGEVQYRVTSQIRAFFCHCNSCRRNTGAPVSAWGRVAREHFVLLAGDLVKFNSSAPVTWHFCRNCGTGIYYENTKMPAEIDFFVSTLNSPGAVAPGYHVQTKEKLPWMTISDRLPQYERWRTDQA